MGELLVKEKTIVVPGEELASGMDFLPSHGTYRENDKIYAGKLGLLNIDGKVLKIVSLSGRYLPKSGDTIIAKVTEILMTGWRVDTNSAYEAVLSMKEASSEFIQRGADLTKYYEIGDYVMAKVVNVTSQKLVDISMKGPGLRKLSGGRFLNVNTHKVPRIIGKQGSMVSLIKQHTNCKILVGQNGLVWVSGENPDAELLTVKAIKKIELEAHIPGLTDRIKKFLESNSTQKPVEQSQGEQ
ncbi:RNA-binding protein [Candidatus Woesearchaeota archaeon]|jgi:exosome complex component RRP4|nr:RNA-binding protein [Candidatus Woesearchaeota archaeon]MBT6519084.1 RNA-binding protein [Candidatus Woesearchaeota archaeon]MBT7367027.1 RNA-binding protein [Candidatus Woesearchaeota archaeon]